MPSVVCQMNMRAKRISLISEDLTREQAFEIGKLVTTLSPQLSAGFEFQFLNSEPPIDNDTTRYFFTGETLSRALVSMIETLTTDVELEKDMAKTEIMSDLRRLIKKQAQEKLDADMDNPAPV